MKRSRHWARCQTIPLTEQWKEWGSGCIKTDLWIETIYNSLTKKMPAEPASTTHH